MGDFTISNQGNIVILIVCGMALGMAFLVVCLFRQMRWAAVTSVLILGISAYGALSLRSGRLNTSVQLLEAIYQDIAKSGAPFPESIDRELLKTPIALRWYYQKNSDQSFAIVYIVSSDGWAMEYPNASWIWIGYHPKGYKPNINHK